MLLNCFSMELHRDVSHTCVGVCYNNFTTLSLIVIIYILNQDRFNVTFCRNYTRYLQLEHILLCTFLVNDTLL